jgi:hypothetical protein
MQDQDDEWNTVVNVKKIKNQERLAEKKKQREEYEKYKLEQERLARGLQEEEEPEDTTKITMGADFDELVSIQAKKDKEVCFEFFSRVSHSEAKKQQKAKEQAKKQQEQKPGKVKKESAAAIAARVCSFFFSIHSLISFSRLLRHPVKKRLHHFVPSSRPP